MKVTIYIPTKNRQSLLQRALESALRQTYSNIEVIVVDDASSDTTWKYLKSVKDPRLKLYRFAHSSGACCARNYAISCATGSLITGLDDDDYLDPHHIELLRAKYSSQYSFVFCRPMYWSDAIFAPFFTLTSRVSFNQLKNRNLVGNQILIETSRIKHVGGFDPCLPAAQDYDLWLRIVNEYGPAKRVCNETYITDTNHDFDRISNDSGKKVVALKIISRKYFGIKSMARSLELRMFFLRPNSGGLRLSAVINPKNSYHIVIFLLRFFGRR